MHPTAIVNTNAELGENVEIGPYAFVGDNVKIGENTKIGSSVFIDKNVTIGKNNRIYPYAVIGTAPQDLKYRGEQTFLEIGDNNIIREFVTINRGTAATGKTIVGNKSLLMAYVHIAHDCRIGDEVILANAVNMGGFVQIGDYVIVGGMVPIHQFVRVGNLAVIGAGLRIVQDICPYIKVDGPPARPSGLNSIGLKRRNFSVEQKRALKRAYKIIFRLGYNNSQAVNILEEKLGDVPVVREIIDFLVARSTRGILKTVGHKRPGIDNNI